MADPNNTPIPDFMPDRSSNDHGALFDAFMQHAARNPYSVAATTSGLNPTQGMSTYDLIAAGAGQGLTDAQAKTAQFLANNPLMAHALGYSAFAAPEVKQALDQAAKDKDQTDAPLLGTTAGKAGSIAGQTAALALLK